MGTVDLNDLPIFVAVAETESFSAAARKLGLPKSSVSRSIAALESNMGVRLLHRTTRHVSLSTAGQALYARVAPSLSTLQQSVGELPTMESQLSGSLRVTASVDFGAAVLAELCTRFVARYPSIDLDVRLDNSYVDLIAEGIDVALRISNKPFADSTLAARKIAPLALGIYASPKYLARQRPPRTPAELQEHTWVCFRAAKSMRIDGPHGAFKLAQKGRIMCDDMSFAREAALHGAGLAVLPHFLTQAECESGRLVRVMPRWHVNTGQLSVVHPNAKHIPQKVITFRDFVIETIKGHPLNTEA